MPERGTQLAAAGVMRRLDLEAHRHTADWPGRWPGPVDPVRAWEALGRPHVLHVITRPRPSGTPAVERAWLLADGTAGADRCGLPDAAQGADPSGLSEALLPDAVISSLERGGAHDDLVVVTTDELRSLAWPMLPLACRARERLNSFAAVTMLPSLSWGAHALRRPSVPPRTNGADVVAYIHPDADLRTVDTLIDRHPGSGCRVTSLDDVGPTLERHGPRIMLITSHGTLTDDGSVDLRDHLGRIAPPDEISTWLMPPIALIAGCRTGASNATAPLHLAEAALSAGASHVITVTNRTTDEVVDDVLAATLRRLGVGGLPATAHTPSQALQAALQQFDRAYPLTFSDIATWSLVHLGLPGSATG